MSELSTDKIILEYFKQKDILVKHQLESYNDYIDNIIPNILSQFFPISIDINNENIPIINPNDLIKFGKLNRCLACYPQQFQGNVTSV